MAYSRHALEVAVVAEQTALSHLRFQEKTILQRVQILQEALCIAHTDRAALSGTHFSHDFLYAKKQLNICINQLTRELLLYTAQYYKLHCFLLSSEIHTLRTRLSLSQDATSAFARGERSCPTC
jgi:hypothetical protein